MTPTLPAAQSCPPPCYTLDQYAQNTSLFAGHTNISLVFLEGVHNLSYTLNISGLDLNTNISLLAFQGQGVLPGDTVINLLPPASFYLSDITNLRMLNMHVEALQHVPFGSFGLIDNTKVHFVGYYRIETKNIIHRYDISTAVNIQSCTVDGGKIDLFNTDTVDIQNCRVVDGSIFTSFSITVNIWNCTVDGGVIDSQSVSSLNIQNCRVADGLILTLSSHTVNIWNCAVDNGNIDSRYVSSLDIQNCRVADGLILTLSSHTVNIWNCAVDNGNIDSRYVSSLDIQNCRVAHDGLILTLSSHTVNIWNCAVDNGNIDSRYVSSLDIQNCRVADGLILTLSSHTINIWNCAVDNGEIFLQAVSSLNIQNCRVVDGLIFTTYSITVNIWNCTVDGGTIDTRNVSSLDIQHCRVVNGSISTEYSHTVNIWNCTVDNGVIYSWYVSSMNIQNCRVVNGVITTKYSINDNIGNCTVDGGPINSWGGSSLDMQNCAIHGPTNLKGLFDTPIYQSIGVSISYKQRVMIQNITVSEYTSYGILIFSVDNVTIDGCSYKNNVMGVAGVNSNLTIRKTNITENRFGLVLAVDVDNQILSGVLNGAVSINNCVLSGNSEIGLQLINIHSSSITDSSFYGNHETPIGAYQSTFELRGENVFRDNTAKRGGGLALFNSTVVFGTGSKTTFVDNKAEEFGGAIYIATLSILSFFGDLLIAAENVNNDVLTVNTLKQSCFFLSHNESITTFIGNNATLGGNDIYGATVHTEDCNSVNFNFDNETLDAYKVSSDPTRVCFCVDNSPLCENRNYFMLNETRYPGETFTISVALAGYNFGRVAGSVYTNVLGRDYTQVIDSISQHIQTVNLRDCGTLTFTLFSNQTSTQVVLALTAQEQITLNHNEVDVQTDLRNIYSETCSYNVEKGSFPCTALLTTPIYINVTLQDCPLGFDLNRDSQVCGCDETLSEKIGTNQTCEIRQRTGYITREGTVWLGVDTSENNTDIYYWHRYCPNDYCNSSQIPIVLKSPNEQCNLNRSGILCGGCQANLSLQLGGNKCIKCKDSFLSLLLVFAVLGILLVAVIKLLNLTVTSGTINGLIFYANVVWRNNAILFSLQDRENIGYYIITLPIAWINLDFGIETCFSENLNQLTKTGLQFVFPVYIWCIAGLIIIVCHYSTRATKLFGNNSVAVLATLFLLSYGKLFRNITDVFTFADITGSNNTSRKVWSTDGNVLYGEQPGHAILIVVALLFLILFLLPFTLTVLLVPFLRAKSHLRPLRWINTLKPFFDTFYGPFKDKKQHQVWTGILLISRVLILIVYASTSTYSPNANILLMTVIATLLLVYNAMVGLIYKKWSLSLLENVYIVNLVILGGAFLFSASENNNLTDKLSPAATTSVVIALFVLICTVIIYTAKRIIPAEKIYRLMHSKDVTSDQGADQQVLIPRAAESSAPTVQVVEVKKYDSSVFREELLETLP